MAQMNGGFEKHGLDDDAFGPTAGLANLQTFDAFPKTKPSYTSASPRGGQWTIAIVILCTLLAITELRTWWSGEETHHFTVERGVGHELQLNLDIVIAMRCKDLHVNIQDAAMDRILAGDLLTKHETNWQMWTDKFGDKKQLKRGGGAYKALHEDNRQRTEAEGEDQHVGHVLGHMREGGRKFEKSPKLRRWDVPDSCRIFGSLEGNKVQGDFHITARGHGYTEFGAQQHLEHASVGRRDDPILIHTGTPADLAFPYTDFNFSHIITELSFGPHYPSLLNPLDKTSSITPSNFYKYQYYLSIVPTIFTRRRIATTRSGSLDPATIPQPPTLDLAPNTKRSKDGMVHHSPNSQMGNDRRSVFTNQYAATSQSHEVSAQAFPGIFFKYDIEPILLIVSERRGNFLGLVVRLVNVVSGVLVGGGWVYQLAGWLGENIRRRGSRRNSSGEGVLHGRSGSLG